MIILSLFDGISCGRLALERANIKIDKYFSSEIDKYAIDISKKNYPDIIQLGDINDWKNWNINWSEIDLLIGGSPCQGFTFSGNRLNFDDHRSKLFFVYVDILNHIKTFNPNIKFLLENVKMENKHKQVIDNLLGYDGILINSNIFSAQNRQRYYWSNIKIDSIPEKNDIVLKDILNSDDDNNPDYFISVQHHLAWLKSYNWKFDDINNKSKPLLATYYKQPPHCPYIPSIHSPSGYRRLSPLECERLQTLPDNYTHVVNVKNNKKYENSRTQRWKCLGNGWTVDVITFILKNL